MMLLKHYVCLAGIFMHTASLLMFLFDRGIISPPSVCYCVFIFSLTAALSLFLSSLSSSYYGLTVWFPDMIKYLQKQEYSSRTKTFVKEKVEHVTFNFTLENQVHRQGEYFNDK